VPDDRQRRYGIGGSEWHGNQIWPGLPDSDKVENVNIDMTDMTGNCRDGEKIMAVRRYGFPTGIDEPLSQFENDSGIKVHPLYHQAKSGCIQSAITWQRPVQ